MVNTAGNGLFYTSAALFYTRSVGLSPGEVGIGLTLAGALSLLIGIPAGHLADLRGAREMLLVCCVLQALAMAAFLLVDDFASFLVVAIAYTCIDRAAGSARGGLLASVLLPADRVQGLAYLRSVTNLGIAGGAMLAGVAIAVGTREAYAALIVGNAVSFVIAGAVVMRLPRTEPRVAGPHGGMLVAMRDRPFLAVTVLQSLLAVHYVVLDVAMPLWVDRSTNAPNWVVAALFVLNTSVCVLFQVRVSRSVIDVRTAALAVRRGSVLLALSCPIFWAASGRSASVAVAVLVAAVLVNVVGELLQASGSWGLGYGLAPDHAQGQYQGLYGTGMAASRMIGPVLVTVSAVEGGLIGWSALGTLFLVVGAATVPVAAWAQRSRPLSDRTMR